MYTLRVGPLSLCNIAVDYDLIHLAGNLKKRSKEFALFNVPPCHYRLRIKSYHLSRRHQNVRSLSSAFTTTLLPAHTLQRPFPNSTTRENGPASVRRYHDINFCRRHYLSVLSRCVSIPTTPRCLTLHTPRDPLFSSLLLFQNAVRSFTNTHSQRDTKRTFPLRNEIRHC